VKQVERRAAFWAKATAKLDALSKRVSSSEEIRSYHRAQQRGRRGAEEVAALQGQIQALQIELENPSHALALLRHRASPRIFVVRCGLPCDPPIGGHSCNGGIIPRFHRAVCDQKADRQVA
jgi:hypothetical protein